VENANSPQLLRSLKNAHKFAQTYRHSKHVKAKKYAKCILLQL